MIADIASQTQTHSQNSITFKTLAQKEHSRSHKFLPLLNHPNRSDANASKIILRMERRWLHLLLLLSILVAQAGATRRVHIPDELSDVDDNEEDEEWKEWGKAKQSADSFGPPPDPPEDPEEMEEYQLEMMKRATGPSMGFVKLRLGVQRSAEEVTLIAERWTDLLKTGSINAKIYAVDRATIMFVLPFGQDTTEVKDFVLSQDEAYEFKLGNAAFRRPGDPPVEAVLDEMHAEKEAAKKAEKKAKESAAKEEL